ncbi:MAG: DNA-methyltransferase [Brevinema sp.]
MQKQEFKNGILYQGDCLLAIIKEYDHILIDPPYHTTNCAWDKKIDMKTFFEKAVLDKNMNIVIFGNEPFCMDIKYHHKKYYKYDLIWVKNNVTGFPQAKNMPMKKYENIMVFSTGSMGHQSLLGESRMVYNPQGLKKAAENHIRHRKQGVYSAFGVVYGKRPSHKGTVKTEFTNYPNNVLFFNREKEIVHPTQKPVALLAHLIRSYSDEGDIIFDGFCGSGSVPIACIETQRKFIGVEITSEYFDLACKRIEDRENNYLWS